MRESAALLPLSADNSTLGTDSAISIAKSDCNVNMLKVISVKWLCWWWQYRPAPGTRIE